MLGSSETKVGWRRSRSLAGRAKALFPMVAGSEVVGIRLDEDDGLAQPYMDACQWQGAPQ